MYKFRIDLRFPAFGGGGSQSPPPPPAVPKTPITPDSSKLRHLQRRTGNARGIAGTVRTNTEEQTGGGLARVLKLLTGH